MTDQFWQAPLSEWDGNRLREFLDESVREGDHLEYKGALPDSDRRKWRVSDDLLETITAMANASDGLIVVGVEADKVGYPIGITGLPHPNPEKAVRDKCAVDIEPAVLIDTAIVTMPEGDASEHEQVMLIRVRRGGNSPYVLRDKGVYVRNDEHDRPARRADLDALYVRRGEQQGEQQSPWKSVLNDIYLTASQTLETPLPIMLLGVTPAFPNPPIDLGYIQDRQFREMCGTMLGYDAEPVLAPESVGMRPDDAWGDKYQFSLAEAFVDGSIEAKQLFLGADEGEDGIANIGVVALWRDMRRVLISAASWPRDICAAGGALVYVLALGNIANSRFVLPDMESLQYLSAIDRRTPAHINSRPMWVARGEWDPAVEVDDLLEREFGSLARLLQCTWWDRLRTQIRKWVQ